MSKIQVFKLAKELGLDNKALLEKMKSGSLELPEKLVAITWLSADVADKVRELVKGQDPGKEQKEVKDAKGAEQAEYAKDVKQTEDAKKAGEVKDTKDAKGVKDAKDAKDTEKWDSFKKEEKQAHDQGKAQAEVQTKVDEKTPTKVKITPQNKNQHDRFQNIKLGWGSDQQDSKEKKQNRYEIEENIKVQPQPQKPGAQQGQPHGQSQKHGQQAKHAGQPQPGQQVKHAGQPQQGQQAQHAGAQKSGAQQSQPHGQSQKHGQQAKHAGQPQPGQQVQRAGQPQQGQQTQHAGAQKSGVQQGQPHGQSQKQEQPQQSQSTADIKPDQQGQRQESESKDHFVKDKSLKEKKKDKKKNKSKDAGFSDSESTEFDHLNEKGKKSKKKWHKKSQEVEEEVKVEKIILDNRMTVADFAKEIGKKNNEVILKLMNLGVMAAVNQYIDFDVMSIVAEDFGVAIELKEEEVDLDVLEYDFEDDAKNLVKRAPVVTVMGHVDHGKTSLLDAIRSTNVISGEAGGITQHIGASEVRVNGEKVVFLDTPGHEAFTSLRARGAKVTDIAILVVSADDGVMPQTIEAIDHAKAADVPIIVAINKIDKPTADPERVIKELSANGVLVEDWGGDTVCVKVSAKQKQNIDQLLEMILLVAEMQDLKANPNRNAVGTVIEANLDKGRGAVATILIQNGSLAVGDAFVCGTTVGRVRAMYDYRGKKLKKAGPSSAVEIIGMSEVATAGDRFFKIDSDKEARQIAQKRAVEAKRKEMEKQLQSVTLEDIFNQIQAGKVKTLDLILKADAHGSIEAIKQSLAKIETDEVKINIHHANVGGITENDIMLATASRTVIIGFNVRPSADVMAVAKKEGVEIRTYQIIYNLIDDIEAAMKGMLEPIYEEVQTAEVEIRTTFKVPGVGTVAGAYVKNGKIERNASIRLLRDGIIVHTGKLSSLKRFKDDVKEVATGYECGIGIENYSNIKEGDIIEAFEQREIPRK